MRLGMGLGLGNLLSGQPLTGFPNDFSFNFDGNSLSGIGKCPASAFTISAWVKKVGTGGYYVIYSASIEIWLGIGSNEEIRLHVGGSPYIDTANSVVTLNQWHHIACTFDGSSTGKIYVDGDEKSISTASGTLQTPTATTAFIGAQNEIGSSNPMDGLIDEVAVWNTALSASDVAKIASKPVDFSKASTYATDRTSNLKLWLRAGDKVLPEEDKSIARSDFYTDFDGADQYVDLGNLGLTETYGSITAWINIPTTASADGVIISGCDDSANTNAMFFYYDEPEEQLAVVGDAGNKVVGGTTDINDGQWHHAVLTSDGSAYKIYLDGKEESLTVSSGSNNGNWWGDISGIDLWNIGIHDKATDPFLGAISNLSIYQTTLDAQTIKQFAKSRYTPMRDNRFSVVDFDGSNDFIKVDADSSINSLFATGGTLSGWINTKSVGETAGRIANKGFLFYVHITSGSTCKLGFNIPFSTTDGAWTTTNHDINFDEWQHIAITYDGSSTSSNPIIYINGISVAVTEATTPVGSISDDTADLYIGNRSATDRSFNGSMSSIALHSTAKSADEIYAIYSKGITYSESSESGLVGLWRMGDDTSKAFPTIADSSSNSNDGTITNGASDDIVQQMVAGYDMGAFESTGEELNPSLATSLTWNNNSYETFITSGNSITEAGNTSGHGICYSSAFSVTAGKVYKFTFNFTLNSGSFSGGVVRVGTATSMSSSNDTLVTSPSNGLQSYYYTPSSSSSSFLIGLRLDSGSFNFSFTDLSIQEVLQSADLSDTYPAIIDVNEPVLGVEAITNGTFDSDSSWTKGTGWTIGSGVATSDSSAQSATSYLKSTSFTALDASTTYKLSFRRVQTNTGSLVMLGLGGSDTTIVTYSTTTTGTDEVVYFKPSGANTSLWVTSGDGNFSGSVDNISIKEVFGNVGTMTNQDSADLVYSSVLPDQSFLTGVNSAYNFIDLDGSDEYIDCGDGTSLDTTSAMTLSVWFKRDGTSTDFLASRDDTSSNRNWAMYIYNNKLNFDFTIGGSGKSVGEGTTTLSADTWFHAVFTHDGSNQAIYINSGVENTSSHSGSIDNDDVSLYLGRRASAYINGKIGQTALWNRGLSSTEVSAIYNLGRHGNLLDSYSDNLVGYWGMSALDASTGLSDSISTIYDRSGNSNHGIPDNADAGDLASSPNAEPNGYSKGDTNRSNNTP